MFHRLKNDRVCIITAVGQKIFCLNPSINRAATVQSAVVPEVIKNRTGIPCASTAKCILVLSPLCTTHCLIPTPCSSGIRMYLDMTGVDHQPLKVSVVHRGLQNLFPDSLVTPPAEPAVYIFQFPYVSGKSRQGAPVRSIQNTPLINCRVSRALPPRVPFSPMVCGLIFSHALSLMSCRCCSAVIFLPPFFFEDYYITFLLTTPSSVSLERFAFRQRPADCIGPILQPGHFPKVLCIDQRLYVETMAPQKIPAAEMAARIRAIRAPLSTVGSVPHWPPALAV